MSELPATPPAAAPPVVAAAPASASSSRWLVWGAVLLAALLGAALVLAWNTQQRVKALEIELVKRQQDSGSQATEARMLAGRADEMARETAARLALLDARVAESVVQRSQLEELIQSLARSRDENVLADVDAALRVALQQTAITGSAEPLVAALRQADDRLARYNQPRLEQVRRAVTKDLEKTRAAGVADLAVLAIRLDEAIRQVDELPLLSVAERRPASAVAPVPLPAASAPARAASAAAPVSAGAGGGRFESWTGPWRDFADHLWQEVRSLVRVTRIDHPEAMLVAPEQAYFLRENLKLRLLNARLALLSRQYDTAQSDLRDVLAALDRYFDRNSRRVQGTVELVRLVSKQARLVSVPWPDATLAAIATASAGR